MLQLRYDEYPLAGASRPGPSGRPTARRCWLTAARSMLGTDDDPWAYDNERPAHEVDCRVPDRHGAGDKRAPTSSSSRRAATTTCAVGPGGGGLAVRDRARAPQSGAARATGYARAPLRACSRRCHSTSPVAARVLVRGRRLRALGGQAVAQRGRSGKGRRRGRRHAARSPGERSAPVRAANVEHDRFAPARSGAFPPGEPLRRQQLIGDVWEWTSQRVRRVSRVPGFPYRNIPRSSSATVPGPPRRLLGVCTRRGPRHPSATGITRSAVRSSPASARREVMPEADAGTWRTVSISTSWWGLTTGGLALERDVLVGLRPATRRSCRRVVLRRARLRAVRRDHPAARVLPEADCERSILGDKCADEIAGDARSSTLLSSSVSRHRGEDAAPHRRAALRPASSNTWSASST